MDDLLCAVSSKKTLEWFQSQFIKTDENPGGFYAKYLGPLHFFLGMAVDQHADYSISVNQTKYIEKMLNKFVPSHDMNAIKHSKPCVVEKIQRAVYGNKRLGEGGDEKPSLLTSDRIASLRHVYDTPGCDLPRYDFV